MNPKSPVTLRAATWRDAILSSLAAGCLLCLPLHAQQGPPPGNFGPPPEADGGQGFGPGRGPGGFGRGPGGPGDPGGPGFGGVREKDKVVEKFDKDGDKILNAAERKAAFEALKNDPNGRRRGPGGPGGRGPGRGPGRGRSQEPVVPGPKVSPSEVKSYPNVGLYDTSVLRTLFIDFEDANWEEEMALFKNTDVEMPANVTVDGKLYKNVGVHFRGMSSFMMVESGRKRSLNLSFDFVDKKQNLLGYRSLELLNSHEDPSFLRSTLFLQAAREYIPSPKANLIRVVINGESWGVYSNVQPFNKDFTKEAFDSTKGRRWKVPGSPRGQGSLRYLGDDDAAYKRIYQIKTKDDPKAWADLIQLCKILNTTPADQLEKALEPILDVDGALRFLALENALVNNDGYWIRTSDYNIYQDPKGKFHILIHDSNETFLRPEGPGGPGGPRGGFGGPGVPGGPGGGRSGNAIKGVELDPLFAAADDSKPLISKLLAVPALKAKYLGYVRDIAEKWLDWKTLGPVATRYHELIAADVSKDTRKLDSTEDFDKSLTEDIEGTGGGPGGRGTIALKNFADQRRAYLLKQ